MHKIIILHGLLKERKMQISELNFFKDILKDRKIQISKNLNGVDNELNQLSSCELNDEGDHAAVTNNARIENIIMRQQHQELESINIALGKIVSGHYGTCAMCGDKIGFQRLKVKPHAIYCIDCREIIETEETHSQNKNSQAR